MAPGSAHRGGYHHAQHQRGGWRGGWQQRFGSGARAGNSRVAEPFTAAQMDSWLRNRLMEGTALQPTQQEEASRFALSLRHTKFAQLEQIVKFLRESSRSIAEHGPQILTLLDLLCLPVFHDAAFDGIANASHELLNSIAGELMQLLTKLTADATLVAHSAAPRLLERMLQLMVTFWERMPGTHGFTVKMLSAELQGRIQLVRSRSHAAAAAAASSGPSVWDRVEKLQQRLQEFSKAREKAQDQAETAAVASAAAVAAAPVRIGDGGAGGRADDREAEDEILAGERQVAYCPLNLLPTVSELSDDAADLCAHLCEVWMLICCLL